MAEGTICLFASLDIQHRSEKSLVATCPCLWATTVFGAVAQLTLLPFLTMTLCECVLQPLEDTTPVLSPVPLRNNLREAITNMEEEDPHLTRTKSKTAGE